MEKYFLIRVVFLLVETIIGILGKHFSKKELNFAGGQLIIWPVETTFFHFLTQQSAVVSGGIFSFNWSIVLRVYSCRWTTDFPASGKHFSSPLSETHVSDAFFFRLAETCFSRKSFILVSGNGFSANNGFRKQKEKLKIK